jgi:hypothetical protein
VPLMIGCSCASLWAMISFPIYPHLKLGSLLDYLNCIPFLSYLSGKVLLIDWSGSIRMLFRKLGYDSVVSIIFHFQFVLLAGLFDS